MTKKWWHDKVAYQIYPKSFMDTNGDGIGDLRGIISKLDYLKELGIDIIWISPIYQSPFVDQGYDISDYYKIAEEFGTMEEFDELLAEAKIRDMYIVMDLVVNHCSDKHEWFQKALADPEGEYADYFYFRKGKEGKEPSNYRSYFGGQAWEPVPGTDMYYLHMFAKEQPDLNWENPDQIGQRFPLLHPGKTCQIRAAAANRISKIGYFAGFFKADPLQSRKRCFHPTAHNARCLSCQHTDHLPGIGRGSIGSSCVKAAAVADLYIRRLSGFVQSDIGGIVTVGSD